MKRPLIEWCSRLSEQLEALSIPLVQLSENEEVRKHYRDLLEALREWDAQIGWDVCMGNEWLRMREAVQTTRALIAWAIGENDDEELGFDFSVSEPSAQPKAKSVHLSL